MLFFSGITEKPTIAPENPLLAQPQAQPNVTNFSFSSICTLLPK